MNYGPLLHPSQHGLMAELWQAGLGCGGEQIGGGRALQDHCTMEPPATGSHMSSGCLPTISLSKVVN
ncbi:hypothetical protein DPEC_G00013410 [Dallia pectoralis]|uniref:Uncharacterized protein n=1 Tax=Dallia pectoralis TaxID=75939 RepID=A0ACC2HM09_DALPE|nr:hypothetical protein DPEC_G00013410 [Dallia pectoralis]